MRLLRVGCALECKFCSTAQQGFNRNLRVSEIIGRLARGEDRRRGEDHRRASHYQRSNDGHGRAAAEPQQRRSGDGNHARRFRLWPFKRRVTLSTSGVVPALDKLGDMIDVALAISLHAPNDTIRDEIVPINKKYNIETFLNSVRGYISKSNANRAG